MNVNKTIDYYVEILGFEFSMGVDDKNVTKIGQYKGMHLVRTIVKENDVEIVKPIHKSFYGAYEFAIRDLNGYVLYFAQQQ